MLLLMSIFIAKGGYDENEKGKIVVVYGIGIIVLQTLIGLLNLLVEMLLS